MKKIAINGFGRIGRSTFRRLFDDQEVQVVAINDLTNPATLAHLLKYDTAYGNFHADSITSTDNSIIVDGREIKVLAEANPSNLP
jgi:glyceraldehyde 3-phosphate dehydrogenase